MLRIVIRGSLSQPRHKKRCIAFTSRAENCSASLRCATSFSPLHNKPLVPYPAGERCRRRSPPMLERLLNWCRER